MATMIIAVDADLLDLLVKICTKNHVRDLMKSSMKFEVPENCGSCLSIGQFGNKYICGMPVSKEKEMLDISAFEVDINSRPDWCPKNEVINSINNLSEENKVLFDRMCDGFSAMFELMNNQRDGN